MRKKIDIEKIQKLSTTEDMFQQEYGPKGTARREEFEAKARAWYYAEVLRDARRAAGMTQQQLADKIGKKREYVCKKQVFDQQFSEKLVSADFGKQLLHILIDKAVMRQRAAASLLGA